MLRAVMAALLMLAGCAPALPRHEWSNATEALRIMSERSERVTTLEGTCRVILRDSEGLSISLDGALAARVPDHFRLRAWKFGRAVLDLTVTPEGVWTLTGETPAGEPPRFDAAQFARAWEIMSGRFGDDATVVVADPARAFTVRRALGEGGAAVLCEIEPRTLTARRYEFIGADGRVERSLTLDRYRLLDAGPGRPGIVWPRRMIAEGADGRVTVLFDDLEFNLEPAPGAFVPPRRAVKQP